MSDKMHCEECFNLYCPAHGSKKVQMSQCATFKEIEPEMKKVLGMKDSNERRRFDTVKEVGKYEQKAQKIGEMVDKKNQLYGSSFEKSGEILKILYPDGVRTDQYRNILGTVRVIDKLFRVANGNYGDEDAWQDVCGYGLLLGKEVE